MSENPQRQDAPPQPAPPVAFSPEDMARRRRRSIALALVLAGLVLFFFVVTLAKTGPAILNRPL
ncbi:MAG: hypothetical protein J0J10_02345 [Bosea sp.]|uniref:hypothetical protein n=1 Tax=Bosea sp. (in: a-proteobacteria) TaxID=1871050 RepID=UPI001ACAC9FA|nr:hypothetical protein [Bosea sp. (in: a-proteobacteria)]MBN9467590.1 hypothetical protein [Bosea sp. (in: a-proteobacteria)]